MRGLVTAPPDSEFADRAAPPLPLLGSADLGQVERVAAICSGSARLGGARLSSVVMLATVAAAAGLVSRQAGPVSAAAAPVPALRAPDLCSAVCRTPCRCATLSPSPVIKDNGTRGPG